MPTNRYSYSIDQKPLLDVGTAAVGDPTDDYAPPAPQTAPPAPVNLTLSTGLSQADRSATAYIDAAWEMYGGEVQFYEVEWSLDGFATVAGGDRAASQSIRLNGLKPGTSYSVRVRAVYREVRSAYSATASITTSQDTTPPSQPTSVSATFNSAGDFVLSGTAPSEVNFARVEAIVKDSASGTSYVTLVATVQPGNTFQIVWPASENVRIAGGDPTLTASVRSQSWAGYYSSATNYSATKSAPTLTVAVDFTGPDAVYTLTPSTDVTRISFVADTSVTAREIGRIGRYVYTFDANRLDHSGTADPLLAYSFTAYDALGQAATAATGSATNAAPSAPTSVAIAGFTNTFSIVVAATKPADYKAFRYRIIQTLPSASDVTFDSTNDLEIRSVDTPATYQVGVKVVDQFDQLSSEALSSATVLDAFTIAQIRDNILYSDDLATSAATLKAAMADDTRTSGGVSYASSASWTHFIRADWQYLERIRTFVLSMTPVSGTTSWYIRTSKDGVTFRYFSGAVVATGGTGLNTTLVEYTTAANAQTNAISSTTLGGSSSNRVDLPSTVEARYFDLYFRNTAASTRVDEFFPRRNTTTDDMQAESIKAINIAAGTITADRIAAGTITATQIAANTITADRLSVSQLSAIAANLGTITAGTVTSATIRTAASGARIELNNTKLFGTDGTTEQWAVANADGKFKAGAGAVILDSTGITLATIFSGNYLAQNALKFIDSGTLYGALYQIYDTDLLSNIMRIESKAISGSNSTQISLISDAPLTKPASVGLSATSGSGSGTATQLNLIADSDGDNFIRATRRIDAQEGINVGSATGAGTGQIKASSSLFTSAGINAGTITDAATGEIKGNKITGSGSSALSSAAGTRMRLADFVGTNNNTTRLVVDMYRTASGSSHDTAAMLLQRITDVTNQGYIALINSNIGINTVDQFGGGDGVIGIANRITAPTTTPSNGGILWVSGGALYFKGSSGTVTMVAPA